VVLIALATFDSPPGLAPFDSRVALAQGRQGSTGRASAKPYATWQSYAGGAHSSQYSALDQINKKNVAKLQVAWSFPIAGASIFNQVVIDGVMYAPVGGGTLAAIDAATGKESWRKDGMAPSGARGMNYWESADRSDRRFIYLQRGDVIAVNAQNGEPITSFGTNGRVDLREAMERKPAGPVGTSNPGRIFENLFIISAPRRTELWRPAIRCPRLRCADREARLDELRRPGPEEPAPKPLPNQQLCRTSQFAVSNLHSVPC
jgi:quinoprotein glucose dehydrogenase